MRVVRVLTCASAILGIAGSAFAVPLTIQSLEMVATGDAVRVDIVFDRLPLFTSADAGGRQADEFQFHLWYDEKTPHFFSVYDAVIRGGEIHRYGNIPIRHVSATDSGGPGSGGWGPIASRVGYALSPVDASGAHRLLFSVPFAVIGDPNSEFGWQLGLYEYGAGYGVPLEYAVGVFRDGRSWTGYQGGESVPEPGTLLSLCVGLAAAGLRKLGKRRRDASAARPATE